MFKRKVFICLPDPATKPVHSVKTFEQVADPAFKPKYAAKKPGVVAPPPPPVKKPEVWIPKNILPPQPPAPMRSIMLSGPVGVVLPRVISTPPRVVAVPVAPYVPPALKPIPPPKPIPQPIPLPEPIPIRPSPEPEHPIGSRAWKIHQFIKANFKC